MFLASYSVSACMRLLPCAVSLTLYADVIAEHSTKDEILLWRQLMQRTSDKQADGIKTLTTSEIDVHVVTASRLHHIVNRLTHQPFARLLLIPAVASEQNHPAYSLFVLVYVVRQHPYL